MFDFWYCLGCDVVFLFSSSRRHTSGALVTGVQTCALPIYHFQYWGKDVSVALHAAPSFARRPFRLTADIEVTQSAQTGVLVANGSWFGGWSFYLKDGRPAVVQAMSQRPGERSEERRVGDECVSTCRTRWATAH